MRDWDDAFANMAHVAGSDALPGFWAARAADYRASSARIDTDISYGSTERESLDIIWPDTHPKGLAVFVHGGYWMRLDKSYWSDLAEGARTRGWAVCIPSYTLTPHARISDITRQIGAAITKAAALVNGPIHLSGHSAGGHLVARMLCENAPLEYSVRDRIAHTLAISGLFDLRPLVHTAMNNTLHLDPSEAAAESPALLPAQTQSTLTLWVGDNERPEFIRQSRLMALIWDVFDVETKVHLDQGHNHFTILEGLKSPEAAITQAWVG
ncbi:alpha/beta hydrolase [Phaeobacter sp. NW0010-22]|uniref:alpha/beta hydrolase n=1 Tax=Phaeobacter sp. NW0010-22 TaxID=3135907 RepID=UPI0031092157